MNPFKNRPLLCCSLIAYMIVLGSVLLYIRFPTDQFNAFCQTKLEQLLPGTQCTIKKIRCLFPVGMQADTIIFNDMAKNKQVLGTIDQLTIRPQFSSPWPQFSVTIKAYSGEHKASVLIDKSKQEVVLDNILVDHLDLAKLPFINEIFDRKITGQFSGNGIYKSAKQNGKNILTGRGNFVVNKGNFSLLYPILSLTKIDLKELKTDIVLRDGQVQFSNGHFIGKELQGDFAGNIILQAPFHNSNVMIRGTLDPFAPLLKKSKYAQNMVIQLKKRNKQSTLPFLLHGSIQKPRFKFDT